MIRLAKPTLGQEELDAIAEVLSTGMLVQGPRVAEFESSVASEADRAHGVAVTNGTSALVLALRALNIGPGDEVLCPAVSWPSPAHAIRVVGARVKLVDVDVGEWNSTPALMAAARTDATTAAIVIDQFGNPLQADAMSKALAGLAVVEDAACALGSRFANGRACGSLGDISTFSFHPRKVLTTGEGGVIVTDDETLAARLRVLRNHGRGPDGFSEPSGNHRLSEMQGAIGVVQMGRLKMLNNARREHAEYIQNALAGHLQFQSAPAGSAPNHQTLGALAPEGSSRDDVVAALRARGVESGALSYALHRLASVVEKEERYALPGADQVVDRGFALPLFAEMTEADRDGVIAAVRAVLG